MNTYAQVPRSDPNPFQSAKHPALAGWGAMAYNGRIFSARPATAAAWVSNRPLAIGAVAIVTVLFGLFFFQSTARSSQVSALEARLARIEAASSRAHLDVVADVQRSVQDHVALMLTNSGQNNRAFPPVKVLPSHLKLRILVTGGAGFVGSHLVDALMAQGHYVYVLDNLFTGRTKNIQHWMGHPNFQFFQADVVEPFRVEVDQIYHLACPASPPHYQLNPIKTIKTSVVGTMNMLGLAKRVKARLLFTSTSEVYGDPLEHPQNEAYWGNVNTWGPRSCYDEGKRVAETMCYSYQKEEGVEVRVARIFNTFGPRMDPTDGRVVSNFIIQALEGRALSVYGDGSQTRSFQYVGDLVTGLIKLMNSGYSQPVNLGNPDEYTIMEFAEKIRALVNPSIQIAHLPATKDDPKKRRPDISLAIRELGWEPAFSVEEGLFYAISYFREELGMKSGGPPSDKSWTRRDPAPLWTATYINDRLSDAERGVGEAASHVLTPKQPE